MESMEENIVSETLTEEEFIEELRQYGGPVVTALLERYESVDDWPAHLKADAYRRFNVKPVRMYVRSKENG